MLTTTSPEFGKKMKELFPDLKTHFWNIGRMLDDVGIPRVWDVLIDRKGELKELTFPAFTLSELLEPEFLKHLSKATMFNMDPTWDDIGIIILKEYWHSGMPAVESYIFSILEE